MTTKIEQIINNEIAYAKDRWLAHYEQTRENISFAEFTTNRILKALDAAGLAVRPIKATEQMARDALPEGLKPIWYPMFAEAYEKVGVAFDPTTYEPEPTE